MQKCVFPSRSSPAWGGSGSYPERGHRRGPLGCRHQSTPQLPTPAPCPSPCPAPPVPYNHVKVAPPLHPSALWIYKTSVVRLSLLPRLSGDFGSSCCIDSRLLMRDKLKIIKLCLFSSWMMPCKPSHLLILPLPHAQQQTQGDVAGKQPLSTSFCFKS